MRSELRKPGVLSVRPGYEIRDGWLTGERAIVVTVERKLADPPPGEALPTELDGVPVDVREASPAKRLELADPAAYAAQLRLAPDAGAVPHFDDERTADGTRPAAVASAHARLDAIAKHELPYEGPPGASLEPIEAPATLTLSASPDAGWPALRAFLAQTTSSLTVGMYDFSARHIAAAIAEQLAGKSLKLVLDDPAPDPTADQPDPATVAQLHGALGDGFAQAWALTKVDPAAAAWIYPTAYHIKVAVRDHAAVWVSSGNWNNLNQPDIDPRAHPDDAQLARVRDRDWHVVVEQPQLADVFERYLLNDLAVAADHQARAHAPSPKPPPGPLNPQANPFQAFQAPETFTETLRITPLLTPDHGVYVDAVKALVSGARERLYLQFQYIQPPKAATARSRAFVELVQAVVDRQKAGVDVRVITSQYQTAGYLEQLQAMGLDVVHAVKIQPNVHNKGIVVDGAAVLVSSQNWSTDGTLYNRDAGVILHSERAAGYFERIFLHDWEHLAAPQAQPD